MTAAGQPGQEAVERRGRRSGGRPGGRWQRLLRRAAASRWASWWQERTATFRTRLVLAATVAVVVAVLAAVSAAYLASRNALVGSVDGSLSATAERVLTSQLRLDLTDTLGIRPQIVTAGGLPIVSGNLPVDQGVLAVANGQRGRYFATITVGGSQLRQLVVPLPAGTRIGGSPFIGPVVLSPPGGALQLATPMTGVNHQLGRLGLVLVLVALAGVVLAVLLGWLVARAALVPLDSLTAGVEHLALTTDVSERLDPGGEDELGRLRRAFNRLLAALERSREQQRQLVLDAAHELRTPLTSLRTNLEVARRLEELPPEDRRVLVDDVLTQLEELTDLVSDLAELARGEQPQHDRERFRLDQLVEDAVALARTHGRHRGVELRLVASPTWVEGSPDRIGRAVGNLLDNALKWSPEGTAVEVTCASGTVTVRDHGPGVAEEDLPHIFDRFYRAPSSRGLPGSGLGLAIVAQVAEAEGGSVAAGQAEGGGARFTLAFPPLAPPPSEGSGGSNGSGQAG